MRSRQLRSVAATIALLGLLAWPLSAAGQAGDAGEVLWGDPAGNLQDPAWGGSAPSFGTQSQAGLQDPAGVEGLDVLWGDSAGSLGQPSWSPWVGPGSSEQGFPVRFDGAFLFNRFGPGAEEEAGAGEKAFREAWDEAARARGGAKDVPGKADGQPEKGQGPGGGQAQGEGSPDDGPGDGVEPGPEAAGGGAGTSDEAPAESGDGATGTVKAEEGGGSAQIGIIGQGGPVGGLGNDINSEIAELEGRLDLQRQQLDRLYERAELWGEDWDARQRIDHDDQVAGLLEHHLLLQGQRDDLALIRELGGDAAAGGRGADRVGEIDHDLALARLELAWLRRSVARHRAAGDGALASFEGLRVIHLEERVAGLEAQRALWQTWGGLAPEPPRADLAGWLAGEGRVEVGSDAAAETTLTLFLDRLQGVQDLALEKVLETRAGAKDEEEQEARLRARIRTLVGGEAPSPRLFGRLSGARQEAAFSAGLLRATTGLWTTIYLRAIDLENAIRERGDLQAAAGFLDLVTRVAEDQAQQLGEAARLREETAGSLDDWKPWTDSGQAGTRGLFDHLEGLAAGQIREREALSGVQQDWVRVTQLLRSAGQAFADHVGADDPLAPGEPVARDLSQLQDDGLLGRIQRRGQALTFVSHAIEDWLQDFGGGLGEDARSGIEQRLAALDRELSFAGRQAEEITRFNDRVGALIGRVNADGASPGLRGDLEGLSAEAWRIQRETVRHELDGERIAGIPWEQRYWPGRLRTGLQERAAVLAALLEGIGPAPGEGAGEGPEPAEGEAGRDREKAPEQSEGETESEKLAEKTAPPGPVVVKERSREEGGRAPRKIGRIRGLLQHLSDLEDAIGRNYRKVRDLGSDALADSKRLGILLRAGERDGGLIVRARDNYLWQAGFYTDEAVEWIDLPLAVDEIAEMIRNGTDLDRVRAELSGLRGRIEGRAHDLRALTDTYAHRFFGPGDWDREDLPPALRRRFGQNGNGDLQRLRAYRPEAWRWRGLIEALDRLDPLIDRLDRAESGAAGLPGELDLEDLPPDRRAATLLGWAEDRVADIMAETWARRARQSAVLTAISQWSDRDTDDATPQADWDLVNGLRQALNREDLRLQDERDAWEELGQGIGSLRRDILNRLSGADLQDRIAGLTDLLGGLEQGPGTGVPDSWGPKDRNAWQATQAEVLAGVGRLLGDAAKDIAQVVARGEESGGDTDDGSGAEADGGDKKTASTKRIPSVPRRKPEGGQGLEVVQDGDREDAGSERKELSGASRQRVAVAGALTKEPDVILSDEPTSAIDAAALLDEALLKTVLDRFGEEDLSEILREALEKAPEGQRRALGQGYMKAVLGIYPDDPKRSAALGEKVLASLSPLMSARSGAGQPGLDQALEQGIGGSDEIERALSDQGTPAFGATPGISAEDVARNVDLRGTAQGQAPVMDASRQEQALGQEQMRTTVNAGQQQTNQGGIQGGCAGGAVLYIRGNEIGRC